MKKILLLAVVGSFVSVNANAGLLDALGFGKKSEPATLEEACDTSEIKKVCPDVLLGNQTITQCLAENIKSLSSKCANFVKKSIAAKKDAAVAKIEDAKAGLNSAATNAGAESETKADTAKAAIADKIDAARANAADKQAAAVAKKEAAMATGKEIADAVRETGEAAKETGRSLKSLF